MVGRVPGTPGPWSWDLPEDGTPAVGESESGEELDKDDELEGDELEDEKDSQDADNEADQAEESGGGESS